MRLLTFLEYAAIMIGAIAIFAAQHYALAKGVHLGILLIGAGLAVGGIESLYSRRMSLRFSEDAAEGYSGFPALVWGTMLLLAGAAVIGCAYLLDVGLWPRAERLLKQNPAIVLIVAGLFLAGRNKRYPLQACGGVNGSIGIAGNSYIDCCLQTAAAARLFRPASHFIRQLISRTKQ